jgi:hypothetical protein
MDDTPQRVLCLEVIDDELVLQAGVCGDLAQAGTFKAGRGEYLKRRRKNARAPILIIRCLGTIHCIPRGMGALDFPIGKYFINSDFPIGKSQFDLDEK